MNNEEKILQVLESIQTDIGQMKQETNARFGAIDKRLDVMDKRLDVMQEDISEIKEHAEVTREATNALGRWAETVSVITKVGYPNP